jgi:hypothetical protein
LEGFFHSLHRILGEDNLPLKIEEEEVSYEDLVKTQILEEMAQEEIMNK